MKQLHLHLQAQGQQKLASTCKYKPFTTKSTYMCNQRKSFSKFVRNRGKSPTNQQVQGNQDGRERERDGDKFRETGVYKPRDINSCNHMFNCHTEQINYLLKTKYHITVNTKQKKQPHLFSKIKSSSNRTGVINQNKASQSLSIQLVRQRSRQKFPQAMKPETNHQNNPKILQISKLSPFGFNNQTQTQLESQLNSVSHNQNTKVNVSIEINKNNSSDMSTTNKTNYNNTIYNRRQINMINQLRTMNDKLNNSSLNFGKDKSNQTQLDQSQQQPNKSRCINQNKLSIKTEPIINFCKKQNKDNNNSHERLQNQFKINANNKQILNLIPQAQTTINKQKRLQNPAPFANLTRQAQPLKLPVAQQVKQHTQPNQPNTSHIFLTNFNRTLLQHPLCASKKYKFHKNKKYEELKLPIKQIRPFGLSVAVRDSALRKNTSINLGPDAQFRNKFHLNNNSYSFASPCNQYQ